MNIIQSNTKLFMFALFLRDKLPFTLQKKIPSELRGSLQDLKENGVAVFPHLLPDDVIYRAREIIDENIDKANKYDSDQRIEELEKVSPYILEVFSNHKMTKLVGECYTRSLLHLQRSMAGKLSFKPNNLGSGQGWHRDSYSQQFKAMFYLSDVTNKNGPFEYVTKSHKYKNIYKELKLKKTYLNKGNTHTRFDAELVEKYISDNNLISQKYTGPKGTIVLFDSRGLHRGSPIQEGERYAITNYFINNRHHQLEE